MIFWTTSMLWEWNILENKFQECLWHWHRYLEKSTAPLWLSNFFFSFLIQGIKWSHLISVCNVWVTFFWLTTGYLNTCYIILHLPSFNSVFFILYLIIHDILVRQTCWNKGKTYAVTLRQLNQEKLGNMSLHFSKYHGEKEKYMELFFTHDNLKMVKLGKQY